MGKRKANNMTNMASEISGLDKTNTPYIGPRPFGDSLEDQKRFFGRDYEAEEIISLIMAHDTVIIYAQSGAGKTSIINAQIILILKSRGFKILPIARVKIASDTPYVTSPANSDTSIPVASNIYMFNALHSMKPEIDPKDIANQSLAQFLEKYFPSEKDKIGKNFPQILIFDQFEEIFPC